jgi:hypothetical protein
MEQLEQQMDGSVEEYSAPTPQAEPSSIEESWELARHGANDQTPAYDTAAQGVPDEGTAQAEPEHLRWAKSIQGDVNPDGTLNVEAVARRAYELNRGFQTQAQQIAQIRQFLSDPQVVQAIAQIRGQQQQAAPVPAEKPLDEKTDEELFAELVQRQVDEKLKAIAPILVQTQTLHQERLGRIKAETLQQLAMEFGPESPVPIQQIEPFLMQRIQMTAQQMGTTPQVIFDHLAERGNLYQALAAQAREIAFLIQRETGKTPVVEPMSPTPQQQRNPVRANLSRPGSPSSVSPAERDISNFEDAWQAAKEELAAKR